MGWPRLGLLMPEGAAERVHPSSRTPASWACRNPPILRLLGSPPSARAVPPPATLRWAFCIRFFLGSWAPRDLVAALGDLLEPLEPSGPRLGCSGLWTLYSSRPGARAVRRAKVQATVGWEVLGGRSGLWTLCSSRPGARAVSGRAKVQTTVGGRSWEVSELFGVNAVWGQRCLGSTLFGVNAAWCQRYLGSTLFGVNAVRGQR